MNGISFICKNNSVILDFPRKEDIFIETCSGEKGEVCFIEATDQKEELLQPKQFTNWNRVYDTCIEPLLELSHDDNFLFQGNNLIVLSSIVKAFREQIKLIYIDPPYNTGNSFLYKDKMSRSLWLLFMKNRLEIAQELLKDDGILVVQCDENEQAYLKILLDELYGEENFLGSIAVVMNPGGRDYRSLARTHEYLLIYGKTIEAELYPLVLDKEFPYHDKNGGFELRSLNNGNIRFHIGNRPNLCYPFYVNPKKIDQNGHFPLSLSKKKGWIEIMPRTSQGVQTVWRWGKKKAQDNITNDAWTSQLVARQSKDSFLIFEKYRKNTRLARTVWTEKEFQTSKGTKHIKELFSYTAFDYPKPELLMARIIDITTKKGDRVMDFFLGSGTTAAVAHKSGRKWIGIEQMDYISSVTIPRLQAVLAGESGGASTHYSWNGGGNFIFAKLQKLEKYIFPYYEKFQNNPLCFTTKLYNR